VAAPAEEAPSEKKKKSKKGKEKETSGKKSRTSAKKEPRNVELLQDGDLLTPVDADVETPEERERVSIFESARQLCTQFNHSYSGRRRGGTS
jgi:hypothetical protein